MSISIVTVFVFGFLVACITLSVGMLCMLEQLSEILTIVRQIERPKGEEQSGESEERKF
jgi:hypothetical protein